MKEACTCIQLTKVMSLLVTLFCFSLSGITQDLKDCSFYIGDFESAQTSMNFLTPKNRYHNFGLCIELVKDELTDDLYVYPQYDLVTFADFADQLSLFLEEYKNEIFPLFLRFDGDPLLLQRSLEKNGILEQAVVLPIGEHCPSISQIIESEKRILLFCLSEKKEPLDLPFYAWSSIAEFPSSLWGETIFTGEYLNGSIERELLQLRDFYPSEQQYVSRLRSKQSDMEVTYSLLDRALRIWTKCGKRPNFVFYSEPNYTKQISWLIDMLSTYKHRTGSATFNGKPMRRILWGDNFENVTNGNFDFPVTEGYSLTLSPQSLGYSFFPASYELVASDQDFDLNFAATKLSLDDNLTGYYDLNNTINNQMNSQWFSDFTNFSFVKDLERGAVLKLESKKVISLNKTSDLGIVNKSFTISVWFKLNECRDDADYCIVGTSGREYRKGLHANIREKTPYFGFYNNDIRADMTIDANQWYNFTIRYNILEGEQCIYINGKKMGASLNHPSFLGESALLLGHGIQQKNFSNGYIDDLYVWSRALSDSEIQEVYLNGVTLPIAPFYTTLWFRVVLCVFLLVFSVYCFYIYVSRSRTKSVKGREPVVHDVALMKQKENSIYLFGEFKVVDNRGMEVTSSFSPKLKEAFLLILLHSLKFRHGVAISKLNDTLWPNFSIQKAANNRGVTMNKLKKLISTIDGIDVFYDDGVWNASVRPCFNCDYILAQKEFTTSSEMSTLQYSKIYSLIERGVLLKECDYYWLEEYRSTMLFDVSDMMISYSQILYEAGEYEFLYKVSSVILDRDDLNEEAVFYRLVFLKYRGHHKKAKFTFDSFTERYLHCYGEPFNASYGEFTKRYVQSVK